ncbi:M1 family metallopeptidase [Hymenobacter lutimineralis]|uniref:Aminopeptidase N n=1 Tax=Hymenobacter lutimineralis TaxID=2606448 RepID=A0A5D6VD83_9BACT|nr:MULTISPECIES: M1 family aminopeptidase [Hymenobacter]QIX61114.1 M1 family metallopeptidase [Hymenobacter sp. BT18]TYZ13330.1 M1 family metallopeptidase [Hymenobacter lutimineralis]
MKYPVLGTLTLLLALQVGALAQNVRPSQGTVPKASTRKKAPASSESVTATETSTVVIPSWLPSSGPQQPAATLLHDLQHTVLDLRFDWAKQQVIGTATLTVRPHFQSQSQLVLDAKGFDIRNIRLLLGNGKEKALTYGYDKRQLVVNLDRSYARTETYQVRIAYVAKPNELPAGGSAAITSDKGLFFINPLGTEKGKPRQIWTQGETENNSAWFPTIDKPNQRMTQEIRLTVDGQYKTLSNGLLVASKNNADGTRTDTWKQALPAAPYLTMIAVGDFAVVKDTWRGKAVDYYVEPKFAGTAKAVFGNTPQMLDFFSKKFGVEYPWEKYAQIAVRDYVSGAMENTSAVVHGEGIQATRRELLDQNFDWVIAHEVVHHWFGNYVTCESWANLPLNESFADYGEFLWTEYKYGADAAAMVQQTSLNHYLQEAEDKRVPLIRYTYRDKEDMFDRHSYQKGGRVLHMLRKYVGDEAFYLALNQYLTRNKYTAVEVDELRMVFEEVTGEDLKWFFDQWFLQRGHPELRITHSYNNGQVSLRVQQQQDTVYTPVYRLPVAVAVWGNSNQPTIHNITVTKADQQFVFSSSQRPNLVKFDDEAQLLAKIDEELSQEELLYQFQHARNYLQKYQAIDGLRTKVGDLTVSAMLRNALNDKFWGVRVAAVEALKRYKGAEGGAVRKEIQRVATTDTRSEVRAAAITTLNSFSNEDFGSVYEAALNDSSYVVISAALGALTRNPTVNSQAKISSLQETPNTRVITALGGYYALNGHLDQYDWFLSHVETLQEAELYTFLPNFGQFMQRMPPIEREKGVKKLEMLARNAPSYLVRLGAYKGLSALAERSQELKTVLQDIRAKEKDEGLKGMYNLL